MLCDRCGTYIRSRHSVHSTRNVPLGGVGPLGQKTALVSIRLCPACAHCEKRSLNYVVIIVLSTIAALGLFRLIHSVLQT
jgi:hypothetical protein